MVAIKTLFLVLISLLVGCSSSNRANRIQFSLAGCAIGGVYGGSKDSNANQNAALFCGVSAMGAHLLAEYIYDDQEKIKNLDEKLKQNKSRFEELSKNQNSPEVLHQRFTRDYPSLKNNLPTSFKNYVRQNKYESRADDKWLLGSDNELFHVDQSVKVVPK